MVMQTSERISRIDGGDGTAKDFQISEGLEFLHTQLTKINDTTGADWNDVIFVWNKFFRTEGIKRDIYRFPFIEFSTFPILHKGSLVNAPTMEYEGKVEFLNRAHRGE